MIGKVRKWFSNYWYYYKWTVLIILFFAAVIVFCIVTSRGNGRYDVKILYTGPHFFQSEDEKQIEAAFEQLMSSDYDGDGKKITEFVGMPAFTDEQIESALADKDEIAERMKYAQYTVDNVSGSFSQQAFVGDASICLLDRYWYQRLLDNGGLVKLSEILGYRPDFAVDDYSVRLGDLYIYQFFDALAQLPDDTLVCFRTLSTASAFTGRKTSEKMYENSKRLFVSVFDF